MEKLIIPDPFFATLNIYSPNDELLGTIFTETQYYEIRCQIKEKQLGGGYYFIHDGNKVKFDKHGRIERKDVDKVPFRYESYLDILLG